MSKPRVVLIAGAAHGGTTISNMVLGQHHDIFPTGKLRGFPQGGMFGEHNVCSCGTRAAECTFWSRIRSEFAPWQDRPEAQRIPVLYRLISEASGRPFVGDVTHNVAYARLLQSLRDIELYLVHLLRDGRGVVYSRIRKDQRIGVLDDSGWQRLRRVARVAGRWASQTRQFAQLEHDLGQRAARIRYEELCRDPHAALAPVGSCLGLDFDAIGRRLGNGEAMQPVPHMLRGNVRLRARGDVVLRRDTTYLSEMPRLDRLTFHVASRMGTLVQGRGTGHGQ